MESILEILTPDNLVFIFKGFGLTLYISLIAIILSTIIGTVLAVMRNGKNPILRIISSIYIEFVHNVPNLLWIFTIFLVFKMKSTPAGITAFTLFTSAALAEIIRGGLNAVDKGQYKAGMSQGFTSAQILYYIILPLLESWFHGLEKVYTVHKFTAFLSIILLIFHNFSMGGLWGSRLAAQFGNLAIYIFASIILVAYLGKYIQYEAWRWIHRLVYLAYILGLFHIYMIMGNRLLTFNLLSFLVGSYALLGLLAGFYIIFLYQKISFPYLGKITHLKRLNHDTREIQIHLCRPFNYQSGQFAFLKIFQEGFESAPHPFSISGGHGQTLYFTVKNSGDHTNNIYDNLQAGSKVTLDRAYGHMIIEEGRENQVWIAGGIGITPFISYIREHPILDKQVHFYYSFRGDENAVYLDLLRNYAQKNPNFELHLIDSTKDGYLNFEQKEVPEHAIVYMCGPISMMKALAKQIKKQNPKTELIYEGFKFK
ncbi:TPA: ABC transporter permease subunit [Streptococcus pneumoniae]|nr:ABC transporter permease subunit [Streptococcus pneumoniae]HEU8585464.1 ABC transporter permease subunit [Streptococcus pneumoniae]